MRESHGFSLGGRSLLAELILCSFRNSTTRYHLFVLDILSASQMGCFRNLCTAQREREAIATDETPAPRPTTPRHQALGKSDSTVQKAASQRSSPKLAISIESASSESTQPKTATKYLSSLLNNTNIPANLRADFSKDFGTGDPSILDNGLQVTGGVAPDAQSTRCSPPPAGHQTNTAENSSTMPKSFDLPTAAHADPVTAASCDGGTNVPMLGHPLITVSPDCGDMRVQEMGSCCDNNSTSVVECSTGWAAASASASSAAASSGGGDISCDTGGFS